MERLTIPATITKDQIEPIGELRGTTNAHEFWIRDRSYPARTLIFIGFAGAREKDGAYRGELRFEPRPADMTRDLDPFDFNKILANAIASLPSEVTGASDE